MGTASCISVASELEDVGESRLLCLEASLEEGHLALKLEDEPNGRYFQGRGIDVVRGLREIHVIEGIDKGVISLRAPEDLDGSVGKHLVHVHVDRRAGSALKGVRKKLVEEPSLCHLPGCLHDGSPDSLIEEACPHVREGARLLHLRKGANQLVRRPETGHGEVFRGPYRVNAIVGVLRYLDRAQEVPFNSVGHLGSSLWVLKCRNHQPIFRLMIPAAVKSWIKTYIA